MMAELESLRKKYFPRVPWTERGPVRRRYLARASQEGVSVTEALAALAEREGFTEPGQRTLTGGADAALAAFVQKPDSREIGMIFGTEIGAFWCDIACGPADAEGWCELIVRSEEGENLTALAHGEGLLRFRRAEA